MSLSLESAALTDIGRIRRRNEDRFLNNEEAKLFAVADGIGGLPGGADAAELTISALEKGWLARTEHGRPTLIEVIKSANQQVVRLGEQKSPGMGIGCTLTCAYFYNQQVLIGHVGDSRAYRIRDLEITPLTEDHSVENEAKARRARGERVAEVEPRMRRALTRCIGQPIPLDVDIFEYDIEPGDLYFFVTDGVTGLLNDDEIAKIFAEHAQLTVALRAIVDLANERGGNDNSTAVAVRVLDTSSKA